jgi:hypothetical protein
MFFFDNGKQSSIFILHYGSANFKLISNEITPDIYVCGSFHLNRLKIKPSTINAPATAKFPCSVYLFGLMLGWGVAH